MPEAWDSGLPPEAKEMPDCLTEKGGRTESFLVPGEAAAARVDVFLFEQAILPSRAQIQRHIVEKLVLVNGREVKTGHKLKAGDLVTIRLKEIAASGIIAEPMALNIIYEDQELLVVDKPAGMVVHPSCGHSSGTLVNAILAHCRNLSGIGGVERPGIVHRLDKDTSGLLVVAKTDEAHLRLSRQFQSREVEKIYLALVHGRPPREEGMIELPIGRDLRNRKKMSSRTNRGREAKTIWRVQEQFARFALLEVRIATGRTHQIRVHLSALGHPVLGDPLYGGTKMRPHLDIPDRKLLKQLTRQALHASRLSFTHPQTGQRLSFFSPLPRDLEEFCRALRANNRK